jgi:hypothetical protein
MEGKITEITENEKGAKPHFGRMSFFKRNPSEKRADVGLIALKILAVLAILIIIVMAIVSKLADSLISFVKINSLRFFFS